MILGTFIRNYKCYKGLNFIPFVTPYKQNNFNLIIGENGTGKSSILEALNVYFQKGNIILTKDPSVRRGDALISPIFLVKKNFTDVMWTNASGISIKKGQIEEVTNYISEYLWSFEAQKGNKLQESIEKIRNSFPSHINKEEYLLIIDGVDIDAGYKIATFEKFEAEIVTKFDITVLKKYSTILKQSFTYLYIPVETSINEYLKLESDGIQTLMRTDVKNSIDRTFNQEIVVDGKRTNIIEFVNDTLVQFVQETQESIQKIEKDYSFDPDHAVKQKVTARDLRGQVISEFFKNRQLKKGSTKINDLSSGQRKKALIDILYSIIEMNSIESNDELIIAIDEPEASLHVNNCFDQFIKLQSIANHNVQTFVTSHWYGSMPIIENGNILHILSQDSDAPKVEIFDCSNVFDNHDAHRIEDINFKSIYDLSSSILSMLRTGDKHWLVVEGISDKYYLEKYLDNSKFRVLSVGGIDRMIEIAEFLSIPLSNGDEKRAAKNKIIFLSDNDKEYKISENRKTKSLEFLRYTFDKGEVKLIDYCDRKHGESLTVEDVMDSKTMWKAIQSISNESYDLEISVTKFELEEQFEYSKFDGDYSFLKTELSGHEKVQAKEYLKEALKPFKTRLSIAYKNSESVDVPNWISNLKTKFS
jgi:energy-coupling factor transporter ATP-binding protein EcfA2